MESGDIAALYLLESEVLEKFDEEQSMRYYANILDLALENLTDALESNRTMSFENAQDLSTLKALYEYALEHFDAKKLADAGALFEILSGLSDSTDFSSSMIRHKKATQEFSSLDQFLENSVDLEATEQNDTFYINGFRN